MQKLLLGISFILMPFFLQAQQLNRYMVFLGDKENNNFSISEPEAFLSSRAIERRQSQGLLLSEEDLPVTEAYVTAVKNTGARVFYRSKWLNALLIEADTSLIDDILALPKVDSIVYVAPGSKLAGGQSKRTKGSLRVAAKLNAAESIQNTLLGVPQMQQKGFSGQGKLIAVFDGGFKAVDELPYFSHFFENGQLLGQHDFTTSSHDVFRYSSHGTKALSTIAAIDSGNFIGTAPLADFVLAVTEDVSSEYLVEEYNWLLAAEWADSTGADIISSSLGYSNFDDPSMNHSYQDMDGKSTVSSRAAEMAAQRGMVVVVSAGNAGSSNWKYIVSPADAKGIISVGAITQNESIATFSSRGPTADGRIKPEVVAVGYKTTVASEQGGFTVGNGTSYAAPQIAGFAASVWQAFPKLDSKEIRALILNSGTRANAPDTIYGWGKPYFPWMEANQLTSMNNLKQKTVEIFPNPVLEEHLFLSFPEPPEGEVYINLYGLTGGALLQGKKLNAIHPGERVYLLDLQEVKKGFYILEILNSGKRTVHKIIKN